MTPLEKTKQKLEKGANKATRWIGSTKSLVVHTVIFVLVMLLPFFGIPFDMVLLVLTTFLSLEAIYLAIFIQMTVNKNSADIEEIQEDMEDIQEGIEEIEKDVDEIQEDIEEDYEQEKKQGMQIEQKELEALTTIQATLTKLSQEIEQIKKK